ncbi:MAG TPA: ABC transporter permease [Vicinamibacterales bacterium]
MRQLRAWLHRIGGLFAVSRADRDIQDELASHLQFHIDDNVRAGMTPSEARRVALARLGSVGAVREEYRDRAGVPIVQHLAQDLRYGARMLLRTPAFTFVAVLTLALGIGANTAIFSIVNAVLLRPLAFPDADRLVLVWATDERTHRRQDVASYPDFAEWRASATSFESMAAFARRSASLAGASDAELVPALQVSSSFFDVLGGRAALGRVLTPSDEKDGAAPVVVLSDAAWRRQLQGRTDAVGQLLRINDVETVVVGVMPREFRFMDASPEQVYVPLRPDPSRSHGYLRVIGRLRPDVPLRHAQAELSIVAGRIASAYPRTNANVGTNVVPLVDAMAGASRAPLLIFLVVVALVLLVACTNVANLVLARNASRERELAVRRALGAGRLRLLQQLLTESLLLACLGGALGLLLAHWGTGSLVALLASSVPAPRIETARIDASVLLFTLLASLATGILFGVLPALVAAPRDAASTMREGGRTIAGTLKGRRTRAALVVIETALAVVLLAGAGALVRGLLVIRATATGFNSSGVIAAQLQLPPQRFANPAARQAFFAQLLERTRTLPDVSAAGLVSSLPFTGSSDALQFRILDRPGDKAVKADFNVISPGYLAAMQVPLRQGRDFDPREAQPAIIVNETAARRFWPGEPAVGKQIAVTAEKGQAVTLTVVGVAGDIRQDVLATAPRAEVFLDCLQPGPDWNGFALVVRSTAPSAALVPSLRATLRSVDAGVPLGRIATIDEVIDGAIAQPRVYTLLLGGFAALALMLAAVGLYGVVSYSVAQRTQEIGVRMALGASRGEVVRLILRQGAGYSITGIVLGTIGGIAFVRLLSTLAPNVIGGDVPTFAAVTAVLLLVTLLASWFPARRGAAVDPLAALRAE